MKHFEGERVYAITMWDFSWLERRWPGAGFEDWGRALDELVERGYNAVRIDAYPHLVHYGAEKEWTLKPVWDQQVWGSPALNRVRVMPALVEFMGECHRRGVKVALSSWFRKDLADTRMRLSSPEVFATAWLSVIDHVRDAGLLDAILWVDLCNEWPGDLWAPFFRNDPPDATWGYWHTAASMNWMRTSIEIVRKAYPQLSYCYSFDGLDDRFYAERDLGFMDLIEHHCWMAKENDGEFAKTVGYGYAQFGSEGYENLVKNGESLYRSREDYWKSLLRARVASLASHSRIAGLPLATTECWGVVDYKDWPLLDWAWVKELCALGTEAAAASGRWMAISTSNFCSPQFVGMWRDVAWHQRLTRIIRRSVLEPDLRANQWGEI